MASPPSVNNENYDLKVDKARKASSNDPGWKYGYWADLQKRDQLAVWEKKRIIKRGCMAHGTRQLETGGSLLHGLQNWQQKGMYKCMFVLSYGRLGYVYDVVSPHA